MTKPIAAVVRVAATPEQAKVLAALLQSEGIPATVDGDSLADEVAVSRRVMNLAGTRVMVPTASLDRAREILGAAEVDAAELEAQALSAEHPETPPRPPAVTPPRRVPWAAFVASGLALVFLALWLGEVDARAATRSPFLRWETTERGQRLIRSSDGVVLADYVDGDRDGHHELIITYGAHGDRTEQHDADGDQRPEWFAEYRGDLRYHWRDLDKDGLFDACIVEDADGNVLQGLRYDPQQGFVLQPR